MRTPSGLGPALAFLGCAAGCATSSTPTAVVISPCAEYRVRLLAPAERAVEIELRSSGLDERAAELTLTLPHSYSCLSFEAPLLAVPPAARTATGAPPGIRTEAAYRWKLATNGATEAVVNRMGRSRRPKILS